MITSAAPDSVAIEWESALDREGVPHDRRIARVAGLTDADLADYSANRAKYQAVIVAPGDTAMSPSDDAGVGEVADDLRSSSPDATTSPFRRMHGLNLPTHAANRAATPGRSRTRQGCLPLSRRPGADRAPLRLRFPGDARPPPPTSRRSSRGRAGSAYLGIHTLPDGRQEMVNAVHRQPRARPTSSCCATGSSTGSRVACTSASSATTSRCRSTTCFCRTTAGT